MLRGAFLFLNLSTQRLCSSRAFGTKQTKNQCFQSLIRSCARVGHSRRLSCMGGEFGYTGVTTETRLDVLFDDGFEGAGISGCACPAPTCSRCGLIWMGDTQKVLMMKISAGGTSKKALQVFR
jgi:hypothetical protein